MDLIWPFVAMFGVLLLLATKPAFEEGLKRARIGLAVIRDEHVVQNARRAYDKVVKR